MKLKHIYNIVIHIIKCSTYKKVNFFPFRFITFDRFSQNLHAYQRTVIPPLTTTNTPISSQQTFTANDTNATNPPPPPAPAAQQQNNNNNNNDGEQENDLLGVLNMLVELFVLCSIIYFYSTFSRFLVVFFIFALLYL